MKKIVLLSIFAAFTAIANAQVTSLHEDFNACDSASGGEHPTGWVAFSKVGAQNWECYTTFGVSYNTPCIQINGYLSGNFANEDWLITPKLDLSAMTNAYFKFYAKYKFAGDSLSVLYSTNYSGSGDPTATGVSWSDLTKDKSFINDTVWTLFSSNVTSIKSTPFYVAFKYLSTTSDGSRWTVDSVFTSPFATGVEDVTVRSMPVTVIGAAGNDHINLSFTTMDAGEYVITVNDMTGRKVYSTKVAANNGANSISINGVNLTSGLYIVEVRNSTSAGVAKVSIN